jgi:large subunit ribosomal protein L4
MVRGALRSALSDRVKANRLMVVDQFKLSAAKTKVLADLLENKLQVQKVLIVDDANESLERSGRNIPNAKVLRTEGLNVYDIVRYDWVIMTQKAAKSVETRLSQEG